MRGRRVVHTGEFHHSQASYDKAPHELYLFYLNRRPVEAAFLELLSETAKKNPHFHLVATMTEMDKSRREWQGETGFINTKYLPTLQGPICYLAGPPAIGGLYAAHAHGNGSR